MQYLRAIRIATTPPEDDLYDKGTVEMWRDFKIDWEEHICCVNLNGNNLEFNMNFWQIRWPNKMSSLHLNWNPIQINGWSKVFFSVAKWIKKLEMTRKTKTGADGHDVDVKFHQKWPLRFLEVSTELVFCDKTPNSDFHFPVQDFVKKESGLDYEHAVEIMFQIVEFVANDRELLKTSVKDLVRCFLKNEVFDQNRVLDQRMFFTCIRDIFWKM
jgi:hypothetical protein